MPTTRPRHQVTETDEVARALDVAARRWPRESRSRLLVRLVQTGSEALEEERAGRVRRRLAAIEATSGSYAEAFGDDHLDELRRDWPT
ncbi:hypothetical protein [Georgenia sp. Z1491]|uniref:hypothetical protein n=1 Tax=Georgenia sp. Z1491 TaxID=3416707 RepID=UPI003CF3044D